MEIERSLRDRSEYERKHVLPPLLPLAEPTSEAHWRTTTHAASRHNGLCRTRSERERWSERERGLDFGSGQVQQPQPAVLATNAFVGPDHREREREHWRESVWVTGLGG